MCVSFHYFPDSQKNNYSCRILNSIADFKVRFGLKDLWMGCIKQILAAFLFGYGRLLLHPCKIQPWPNIHLGNNNFPPFPSWAVNNFAYYSTAYQREILIRSNINFHKGWVLIKTLIFLIFILKISHNEKKSMENNLET